MKYLYHGELINWSKTYHYGVHINWSKSVQKLFNNGQDVYHYGVGEKQWSAIVFTVFETF